MVGGEGVVCIYVASAESGRGRVGNVWGMCGVWGEPLGVRKMDDPQTSKNKESKKGLWGDGEE